MRNAHSADASEIALVASNDSKTIDPQISLLSLCRDPRPSYQTSIGEFKFGFTFWLSANMRLEAEYTPGRHRGVALSYSVI